MVMVFFALLNAYSPALEQSLFLLCRNSTLRSNLGCQRSQKIKEHLSFGSTPEPCLIYEEEQLVN